MFDINLDIKKWLVNKKNMTIQRLYGPEYIPIKLIAEKEDKIKEIPFSCTVPTG